MTLDLAVGLPWTVLSQIHVRMAAMVVGRWGRKGRMLRGLQGVEERAAGAARWLIVQSLVWATLLFVCVCGCGDGVCMRALHHATGRPPTVQGNNSVD